MADFLEGAHTSSPLFNRLVVTYYENGVCVTEAWECFDMGDITQVNGEPVEVVCTDIRAGENKVVATINSGATKKISFSLSRLLPADSLSKFFQLIKRNCRLKMYLIRASICEDVNDVNDFKAMDYFGTAFFGNYTRTQHIHLDESQAAAVMEGTTVTVYEWEQIGVHGNITLRGDILTDNLIDIVLCDNKKCADPCLDDSDGCQKWFAIQNNGMVWWTDDQASDEAILTAIVGWTGTAQAICCVGEGSSAQIAVLETTALGAGTIWVASRNDIISGDAVVWTEYAVDTDANALESQLACHCDGLGLWTVGENGSIYQYDSIYGTVTPVAGVANVITDFTSIEMKGKTVLIGGLAATVLRSQDGGNSFVLMTVTDPLTGLDLDPGIDIVDVAIITKSNWMVATSDDRVLYTLNDGVDWFSQLIPGQGAGNITSIEFWNDLGYMTRDNIVWKTFYGNCQPWHPLPETDDLFPEVDSLNSVKICPHDPNVFFAVGSLDGAVGTVIRGTGDYA